MNIKTSIDTVNLVLPFIYLAGTLRGSNPITLHNVSGIGTNLVLPSTISNTYDTVFIRKFGFEDVGIIEVYNIQTSIRTLVNGNGSIRWQISGDEGITWTTFIEESFDVAAFTSIVRSANGTWITSFNTGDNQIQIRLQALSNSGQVDLEMRDASVITIAYRQKIEA